MTVALSSSVASPPLAPRSTRPDVCLAQLVDAYMAHYTGRDASRVRYLQEWVERLGELAVTAIDADTVADVLDALADEPARRFLGQDAATGAARFKVIGRRRPATINRYKSALSAVLTWAKARRYVPRAWSNPCREIPALRENNARVRFLSPAERERLLTVARVSAWPKLYVLILTALTTGARRGELMGLRWRDLDLETGTAHLATSKNGQPRVLPLTPAVIAELRRHARPHPDALVFASRYRPEQKMNFDTAWQRALADARIENFRFHDLRHSCASYLAQSGASLLEIADVLGHKSLDVTRRYAHLTVQGKSELVNRVLGTIGGGHE